MKHIFCFLLLFITSSLIAQTSFEKIINTNGTDAGYTTKVLADGNFLVGFSTTSVGAGSSDIGLMKITPTGQTIWTKLYGGNEDDYPSMLLETPTGDILILGMTHSFGAGDRDIYLLKTNANGELLWSKTYGNAALDRGFVIIPTLDGGYAIAGSSQFDYSVNYNGYVLKIDSVGNMEWNQSIGGGLHDTCMDIRQNPDGSFMLAISFSSYGAGSYDVGVCKLDSEGNMLWSTIAGGGDSDNILTLQPIGNNNYLITGHTRGWGSGNWDIFIMRINATGGIVWAKTYGGQDDDYSEIITPTQDGNFVIQGWTKTYGSGEADFYLMKITADGDIIWANTYGGTANDNMIFGAYNTAQETSDGGFIMAIQTESFGNNDTQAFFVRTYPDGSTECHSTPFVPIVQDFNPTIADLFPEIQQFCTVGTPNTIVTTATVNVVTLCENTLLPPIAQFQTDTTRICSNTCIDFFDQSTNNPTQWQWTFEGGTPSTSTDQNPSQICYTMPGMYDVSLTATNAAGNHTILLPDYLIVAAQNSYICQPSPIELLQLHVTEQKDHKLVQWITATETNNDYYSLYTSFDGKDFVWQQNITAKGNSQTATSYHYADFEHWQADKVYYQLYQTDKNGKKSYVGQTFWQQQTPKTLILPPTPNPAHNELHIQRANANNDPIVLEIFDMLGRKVLVHRLNINASTLILPLHLLPAGQYLLRASNNINTETHSFQKTTH